MMAINSALASSPTLARSNQSSIKPSHTLPRDSKRKRHQRREVNKSFAAAIDPQTHPVYTTEVPNPGWRVKAGTRPRYSGSTSHVSGRVFLSASGYKVEAEKLPEDTTTTAATTPTTTKAKTTTTTTTTPTPTGLSTRLELWQL